MKIGWLRESCKSALMMESGIQDREVRDERRERGDRPGQPEASHPDGDHRGLPRGHHERRAGNGAGRRARGPGIRAHRLPVLPRPDLPAERGPAGNVAQPRRGARAGARRSRAAARPAAAAARCCPPARSPSSPTASASARATWWAVRRRSPPPRWRSAPTPSPRSTRATRASRRPASPAPARHRPRRRRRPRARSAG